MAGSMPFLFRFMVRQMEPMIGRDYELGLARLNGHLNASTPHPEMEFNGPDDLQDFIYWAIPCNGNLRQLETARRSGIETLQNTVADNAGLPLTLYHRFDPLAAHYQAEIAIPISENTPLSNYRRREFTGGRYFKMTLHGDLQFLPLGWYALSSHCRMHKIKLDKARPALEIYHDDSATVTDSNQIKTTLYIPIK
jgi:predicted transcriptional regulator YdeE